jgi:ferredoxin
LDEIFRVTIDREDCISCATCWTVCPEFFEENPDDGFSQIVAQYRVADDLGRGEGPGDMEDCVAAAAYGCPVEIIEVDKT